MPLPVTPIQQILRITYIYDILSSCTARSVADRQTWQLCFVVGTTFFELHYINFTPAAQGAQDFHASPRAPSCYFNRTISSTSPSLHQIKRKNSSDQINMIRG